MNQLITLQQLREFRGYSQRDMANRLRITQSSYSKIERFISTNYRLISKILETKIEFIRSNQVPITFFINENGLDSN
jgi:transcriptional regulator with XRE-family HTH domain